MPDGAPAPRLSAEDFVEWAEQQPGRFELVRGMVIAMAPERIAHVQAKGEIFARLRDAIMAAKLPCQTFTDGASVKVDEGTVFEPDAIVRCGPALPGDSIFVLDPLVVVEVLSPSTRAVDTGHKLDGYFRVESVRHYLIFDPAPPLLIHHERRADGLIVSHIVHNGTVRLDPPGIELSGLFPD